METEEQQSQIQPEDVSLMNRREKRERKRYFLKMFKEHLKAKPMVDLKEDDLNKQAAMTINVQKWATRYGILMRKIIELGGTEKDFKGLGQ